MLRQPDGKRKAVKAFKGIGFGVVAAGDSYNDLSMLRTADRGVLFNPPDAITKRYPRLSGGAGLPDAGPVAETIM